MRSVLKRIEAWAFAGMRRVLAARGRDLTDLMTQRSTLVIAPHPDDETLGCGATIAKAVRAGREVQVVIVCDGRHSHQSAAITPEQLGEIRRAEVVEACRALGVPPDRVHWIGCEDRHLEGDADLAQRRLGGIIRELGPQQILAPSGIDRHMDHRALASIVHRLMADGTIRCPVYEYPVWFFSAWTWMGGRRFPWVIPWMVARLVRATLTLRPVLVRTSGALEQKRRALEAFTSQMNNLTGEPTWQVFDQRFLSQFFGPYEIFFVPTARAAAMPLAAGRPEAGHA
jgi:LmbE family N-acetylglucosaminyl deacetylase